VANTPPRPLGRNLTFNWHLNKNFFIAYLNEQAF
jgi:hypothetical protein